MHYVKKCVTPDYRKVAGVLVVVTVRYVKLFQVLLC